MRNRILILLCAALAFAAAPLEATPPKKNTTSTQKIPKNATPPKKSSKPVDSSSASNQFRQNKKNVGKIDTQKERKTLITLPQQKGKQQVGLARHKGKKIAKKETDQTIDKKTKILVQRKEIVSKAIAQARSRAKIQQVSAIGSTLYAPVMQSAGVLVVDERSGQVIYEKNAHQIAPIASISKIMTAMVVLDAHLPMNELLTITQEDIDRVKKSSSRLTVGTKLTRAEMLLLSLMSSENRATSALSRYYPGGQEAFIRAMNQKVQDLGMKNTRFYDPTGLHSGNVSTPHDLSLMVSAAHRYPEIHQFSTSMHYSFISNVTGKELVFRNTNPLTHSNEWNIGVSKTGYISEAGKCLVMQATINSAPVVIVLLASSGKHARVNDAQCIKKWMESDPAVLLHTG